LVRTFGNPRRNIHKGELVISALWCMKKKYFGKTTITPLRKC
jgi:hypothetical protein